MQASTPNTRREQKKFFTDASEGFNRLLLNMSLGTKLIISNVLHEIRILLAARPIKAKSSGKLSWNVRKKWRRLSFQRDYQSVKFKKQKKSRIQNNERFSIKETTSKGNAQTLWDRWKSQSRNQKCRLLIKMKSLGYTNIGETNLIEKTEDETLKNSYIYINLVKSRTKTLL